MERTIKIGIGVLIEDGNKILLGHRVKRGSDTGGIFEPDSWCLPGGKQEYDETIYECAKREVKEEADLEISDIYVFGAEDDIQPDRHFVTLHMVAKNHKGTAKVMEIDKQDKWEWFEIDNLPKNIYSPSRKFINNYINSKTKIK